MSINHIRTIAILVLLVFTTTAYGQNPPAIQPGPVSTVTGSVSADGTVRMIAHGEALQIRMEVYSAAGELVSDSGLRQGSIVDWKQTDAVQATPDGTYLVVITVKDFKGSLNQRMAALSLQAGQLQLQNQPRNQVTTAQLQTVETRREGKKITIDDVDNAISILRDGKERAVVVAGHDGADGQVSSTSGSLTFRTGNVFSNSEQEQMRITPEGRVGIGTKTPEATLDVAGTV